MQQPVQVSGNGGTVLKCPVDGETLQMMERQGVEIDYCPICRGVWLDRGELDKLIERSTGTARAAPSQQRYTEQSQHGKPRKKESIFSELFDF